MIRNIWERKASGPASFVVHLDRGLGFKWSENERAKHPNAMFHCPVLPVAVPPRSPIGYNQQPSGLQCHLQLPQVLDLLQQVLNRGPVSASVSRCSENPQSSSLICSLFAVLRRVCDCGETRSWRLFSLGEFLKPLSQILAVIAMFGSSVRSADWSRSGGC